MSSDLVAWLRAQLDEDERDLFVDEKRAIWRYLNGEALRADIAAKRAILDLHAIEDGGGDEPDSRYCWNCFRDRGYNANSKTHPVWCGTVRLLASAYATRPGYQEGWRP